ncbi:hypothetical protein Mgra_00009505, partial [Meloidogyne graminicola]
PKRIHSDRGKEFLNSILENITQILKSEENNSVRMGLGFKTPYIVFAINATPSETTGFSPYTLMFGRTVNFPTDENIELGVDPRYTVDEETYLQAFRENLENIFG